MSESSVAIIGSGIAGTTIAYHLTQRGHDVTMFEAGPECPYPHAEQFETEVLNLSASRSLYIPRDLRGLEVVGDYLDDDHLPLEQIMAVGGMATRWSAWTPRFLPRDFNTKSRFGYGVDWPLRYEELEPYYCRAEALLGVSGSDEEGPVAAPRSKPYPLPAFALAYDDKIMHERLARVGIPLHSVPQARASRPHDGRPACANFGACATCPIGARYSPNHHLELAKRTGLLTVLANTAVRRIVSERPGQATSIVYHEGNGTRASEHHAKVVILAAGAIASARLLLLSRGPDAPDGLGNHSGHVGAHLMFSHIYGGALSYKDALFGGRVGPRTAQSYQVREEQGKKHGGVFRVSFGSSAHMPINVIPHGRGGGDPRSDQMKVNLAFQSGRDVVERMRQVPYSREIGVFTETLPTAQKYVALSSKRKDRFGDPFALVRHESDDFDHANAVIAHELMERFASATGAQDRTLGRRFASGHHHLGGCRMADDPRQGVASAFGQVHGMKNLFLAGASLFPGGSQANPTLTLVALALRTTDHLLAQVLGPR